MNRKAQSAVEFVVLIFFMFAVFFAVFLTIQNRVLETTEQQNVALLGSFNNFVVAQLDLARASPADFVHEFTLPTLAVDYSLELLDNQELLASFDDGTTHIRFLSYNVSGELLAPGIPQKVYYYDGEYSLPDGSRVTSILYEGVFLNVPIEQCATATAAGDCSTLDANDVARCNAIDPSLC